MDHCNSVVIEKEYRPIFSFPQSIVRPPERSAHFFDVKKLQIPCLIQDHECIMERLQDLGWNRSLLDIFPNDALVTDHVYNVLQFSRKFNCLGGNPFSFRNMRTKAPGYCNRAATPPSPHRNTGQSPCFGSPAGTGPSAPGQPACGQKDRRGSAEEHQPPQCERTRSADRDTRKG